MQANYYVLLGIGPDANQSQIRRAYRQRAHECHPDHDPEGAELFHEVRHAYEVLSDPAEKARYDRELGFAPRAKPRRIMSPEPADLISDFERHIPSLEEIVDLFARNFYPKHESKVQHPKNLSVEVVISPVEAQSGGAIALGVPVFWPCKTCEGVGRTGGAICDVCEGRGAEQVQAQVDVLVPAGTNSGDRIPVNLRHLGIRNMNLELVVKVA